MWRSLPAVSLFVLLVATLPARAMVKVVVFFQPGFPTIASEPIDRQTLGATLGPMVATFADLPSLRDPATLAGASLFVLPYGSAFPGDAWPEIQEYLKNGGNLLILGGQPLEVPVFLVNGRFVPRRAQDSYANDLGFRHTYEVPVSSDAVFSWRTGFDLAAVSHLHARHYFTVEGRLNGLGYMVDREGERVAAPVIVADKLDNSGRSGTVLGVGGRVVALDFDPESGYWRTEGGKALVREAADYARTGAQSLSVEMLYSVVRPTEVPQLTLHLRRAHVPDHGEDAEVKVDLASADGVLQSLKLPIRPALETSLPVVFSVTLKPGLYTVNATYSEQGRLREFYQNGFWVANGDTLKGGPTLGVKGDFLSLGNAPFLPVGTNYFTTEENGWDFSRARNAAVWDHDFAEMASHGVSFVRTGVWMSNISFLARDGGVTERFLRNLEGYLLAAQKHGIVVNFTFFAFSPNRSAEPPEHTTKAVTNVPPLNPYLDPIALVAEQRYVRSIVERFHAVPWLCWDLINEPSFSNPHEIFKGNYPNGDAAETDAWHLWLRDQYGSLRVLADAWSVTSEELGSFDLIPLPAKADLVYERYGNARQVRAIDYALFAQASFSGWVKAMVATIRATGSKQLVDVGQDEGGVTDRVLNHFYGGENVSFTTNHTYWQDDALLWDSVAAKRVGVPNITGETGYQPAWAPDGEWRYDEFTGLGLTERKWALGFAAGSSGALQWDWAREVDFGMQRSDGSAKVWENRMRDLGQFAKAVAPFATGLVQPDIAIVLPQSYQMSVANSTALMAQKNAVRALFNDADGQAYAVGEYQIGLLGSPKLILLPSPMGFEEAAWNVIIEHVRAGSVLLVTGPFDGDAHLHPTDRQSAIGLPYRTVPLTLRENLFHWPGGTATFGFEGNLTTTLSRAQQANGADWSEVTLGKGRILFSSLPLELSDNLTSLGEVYRYAMQTAHVETLYRATKPPGILICPTEFPEATLYVLTSETEEQKIAFDDRRSGRHLAGNLPAGSAALLLVGTNGRLIARDHWHPTQ